MYPSSTVDRCIAPSQAQLALALAIVKSKPAGMDIKEHILQIRSHIRAAKNPERILAADKYFDSVAFWKQAYSKSEAAQSKLLDRIYDLEQRNESLLVRLKPEPADMQGEKRKGSSDPGVSGAAKKRAKTARPSTSGMGSGKLNDVLRDVKYEETRAAPFMRQLYTLHQTLQKKPNYRLIVANSVELCKAGQSSIVTVLLETKPTSSSSKPTEVLKEQEPDPISLLCALELAYELLFQALNKLANSTEGRKYEGHLVYHLVSLFETILRVLEQRSKAEVELEGNSRSPTTQRKPARRQKLAAKSKQAKITIAATNDSSDISEAIVRLLAAMMLLPSSSNSGSTHKSLLEGYLFVLLSRVGKILCLLEFRDLLLRPDLRADPAKLPMPEGLLQDGRQSDNTDDAAVRGSEIEAKYLIWLLERAMAVVYSLSMKSASNAPNTTTSKDDSNTNSVGQPPLLRFAKRQLQSTLLKAVFGEKHALFADSLKRPQKMPGAAPNKMDEESASASEWFPREVWRLLGWDMLAEGLAK